MKHVKLLATSMLLGFALIGCVKELEENTPSGNQLSIAPQAKPIAENGADDHVPNELLIKFKKGVSEAGKDKAFYY